MLCAKNLKVALAAILGVVSLVGAGTAHAVVNLNPAAANDAGAQLFAAERIYALTTSTAVVAANATSTSATPSGYHIVARGIAAAFEAGETYYLRFDLLEGTDVVMRGTNSFRTGGENGAPTVSDTDRILAGFNAGITVNPVMGDAGSSIATTTARLVDRLSPFTNEALIYSIEPGAIDAGQGDLIWALPANAIMVGLAEVQAKAVAIRLTIWGTRPEARRADSGLGTGLGSSAPIWTSDTAAILKTVPTLGTSVTMPQQLTASVAADFRRFLATGTATTSATEGILATANVAVTNAVMSVPVLDVDSSQVELTDLVASVTATVTGTAGVDAFDFGNFYLGDGCTAATDAMTRVPVMGTTTVTIKTTGSLSGTFDGTAEGATATGASATFCVNVSANTASASSTYEQIEATGYNMALEINLENGGGKYAIPSDEMGNAVARPAGEIIRDGTTVQIAYLTTSTDYGANRGGLWTGWVGGSYNQRLTITNYGSVAADYTLKDFVSEPGVTVGCVSPRPMRLPAGVSCAESEMEGTIVSGTLPARTSITLRVAEAITIMGGNPRTSGTLLLVARPQDIGVATVQVTLPEGQTDTVQYQ